MESWGTVLAEVLNQPTWIAAVAASLVLGLLLFALWRTTLRLGFTLAGDPEAGGSFNAWAKLGPVRADWQKQSGKPTRQTLRVLGVRVRSRDGKSSSRRPKARTASKSSKKGGSLRSLRFLLRHWDLREIGSFAWRRRRDIRVNPLEGRAEFGFAQPERTGELYGALCVLTGVVPPLRADADGSIRTPEFALFPEWSLRDHLTGHAKGGMEIRVIRAALSTLGFFLTHWHPSARGGVLHA